MVIAGERVSAMRTNVISNCYGSEITRKRKLLEKQKEGKKRIMPLGSVLGFAMRLPRRNSRA